MSLIRSPHRGFSILCGIILAAWTAHAQEYAVQTTDLTRQADVVVVGKVAAVHAGWNNDRSRIQSTITVVVDRSLKGAPGSGSITLVAPGGEVDGIGEYYSHTARFTKDEDVVVFARKDAAGQLRVTGGEQGKVAIRQDAQTGARMVSGDVTLEAFIARVRSAAADVTK